MGAFNFIYNVKFRYREERNMLVFLSVSLALIVLYLAGLWFLFEKAGVNGWKAIIPFYNSYIEYELVWGSGWLFLFMLVPFAGLVFSIITFYKLGRVYGKGRLFCIGIVLLPFVFVPIIGFGSSRYMGTLGYKPGKYLIVSGIVGLVILALETAITFYIKNIFTNSIYGEIGNSYSFEDLSGITGNDYSIEDLSGITQEITDRVQPGSYEKRGKVLTDIYDENFQVEVPVMYMDGMDESTLDLNSDRVDYSPESCIDVSISVSRQGGNIEDLLEECVTDFKNETNIVYSPIESAYSDVTVSEISRKDNSVCQQVSSIFNSEYGKYPIVNVVKVEDVNGLPIIYRLSIDYSKLAGISRIPEELLINVTKTWNSLLDMYGIGIREVQR